MECIKKIKINFFSLQVLGPTLARKARTWTIGSVGPPDQAGPAGPFRALSGNPGLAMDSPPVQYVLWVWVRYADQMQVQLV